MSTSVLDRCTILEIMSLTYCVGPTSLRVHLFLPYSRRKVLFLKNKVQGYILTLNI